MSYRSPRANLDLLIKTKEELKTAINSQDGTIDVSTPFAEYADQIGDISFGPDINWAQIGYKQEPPEISNGYEYARYIVDHKTEFPNISTNKLDVSGNMNLTYLPSCSKLGVNSNNITSLSFYNCINLVQIEDKVLNTQNITRFNGKTFYRCINLKYIPKLDISTYTSTGGNTMGLFSNLYSLETIDPSNNTEYWYCSDFSMGFNYLFSNCYLLKTLPVINCGKLPASSRRINRTFQYCASLTDVSIINTSNITDMGGLFQGCTSLTNAPYMDTQNVSSMSYMFQDCKSLTTVPLYDTQNVSTMEYMFSGCSNLTDVPQFNTQNVTNMSVMFRYCNSLTRIPQLDTQKVTNMYFFIEGCKSLTTIDGLDFKSISSEQNSKLLVNTQNNSIRKMYIKNIGYSSCPTYDLSKVTNWGINSSEIPDASLSIYKSLVEDTSNRAAAGSSTVNIKLNSTVSGALDNSIKAAICAKGYKINGTTYTL